jgi:glycosyltransferase involved in cell wall biosynthesis
MIDRNRVYDFTVIIPCHNAAGHIMPLLHTLAMQDVTGLKMQYVFVVDSCTDSTDSVLRDHTDMIEWDKLTIIECEHGRAGLSRNEGIEVAEGKYIAFLDSDDNLIRPDFFKLLHMFFEEYAEADIVLYNFIMNDAVMGVRSNSGKLYPACWARAYRREIIGDTRFNDKRAGEDLDFTNEILAKKPKCIDCGKTMIWYNYPREGSLASEWEKEGRPDARSN